MTSLVVCSTSRRLIALDPATGQQRWIYDPKAKPTGMKKCRGISAWKDDLAPAGTSCKTRIFLGTADYRLVAIDAKNGKPCTDFGVNGEVQMHPSKPEIWPGEVSAGSRPAVVNDVVVVGSSVADDQRLDAPSGRVLAFDARTGDELWSFPAPAGVIGVPTSFEVDGEQYIAVTAGWGLDAQGVQNGIDKIRGTTTAVPKAGTVLVFKLRKA